METSLIKVKGSLDYSISAMTILQSISKIVTRSYVLQAENSKQKSNY